MKAFIQLFITYSLLLGSTHSLANTEPSIFCQRLDHHLSETIGYAASKPYRQQLKAKVLQSWHDQSTPLIALNPHSPIKRYIASHDLLALSLSMNRDSYVIHDDNELRHITSSMHGNHVILAVNKLTALNPARTQKVIQVAQARGLRISSLWLGSPSQEVNDDTQAQAKELLKSLADQSAGYFYDLSIQPCL